MKNQSRRDFIVGNGKKLAGISVLSTLVHLTAQNTHAQAASSSTESPVTRYDHDPSWPRKPETYTWAGIPAIMIDKQDQVWVSNRAYPAMQIYDTNGNFVRAWDNPELFSENGPALFKNKEDGPYNLHYFRFDNAGNVWIANTNRHIIQKCDMDGNVLMTIGTPDQAGTDKTHLNRPTDMTVTHAGVFISDGYGNRRVVHYSTEGKFIKAWGQEGTGPEDFIDPHAICHVKNHLYVVDRGNVRIKVYDFDGKLLDIWKNLILPFPLIPTESDEIWTCGTTPIRLENYRNITGGRLQQDQLIMRFNFDGKILQIWSFTTCARNEPNPGSFNMLHGIAVDSRGDLYLGEAFNPGPQKFVCSNELAAKVEGEYR